jgi:hypothetical protein
LPRYGGATEGTIPDNGGELAKEPEILRCLSEDLERPVWQERTTQR